LPASPFLQNLGFEHTSGDRKSSPRWRHPRSVSKPRNLYAYPFDNRRSRHRVQKKGAEKVGKNSGIQAPRRIFFPASQGTGHPESGKEDPEFYSTDPGD
jgi:hypothetical protein